MKYKHCVLDWWCVCIHSVLCLQVSNQHILSIHHIDGKYTCIHVYMYTCIRMYVHGVYSVRCERAINSLLSISQFTFLNFWERYCECDLYIQCDNTVAAIHTGTSYRDLNSYVMLCIVTLQTMLLSMSCFHDRNVVYYLWHGSLSFITRVMLFCKHVHWDCVWGGTKFYVSHALYVITLFAWWLYIWRV